MSHELFRAPKLLHSIKQAPSPNQLSQRQMDAFLNQDFLNFVQMLLVAFVSLDESLEHEKNAKRSLSVHTQISEYKLNMKSDPKDLEVRRKYRRSWTRPARWSTIEL